MPRVVSIRRAGTFSTQPSDTITLPHDQRRVRRKLLTLAGGEAVMLDLPATVTLADGDALELDDGRTAAIVAAAEPLYLVHGRNANHLIELAWHLGNRHLPVAIGDNAIQVGRDPVIRAMLVGLGATVTEVTAAFSPMHGAYHDHGHALLNR